MENIKPDAHQTKDCPFNPMEGEVPSSRSGTQEEHDSQAKEQPGDIQSMYCKELVFGGDTELSFEELRSQRYFKQLNEKLLHLSKVKADLKFQIEQKQNRQFQGKSNAAQFQQPKAPQQSTQKVCSAPTETASLKNCETQMSRNFSMRIGVVSQDEDMGQGRTHFKQRGLQASNPCTVYDKNALTKRPNTRSSSTSYKSLKLPNSVLNTRQPASEFPSDKDVSISRSEEAIINGHKNKTLCRSPDDTCDFFVGATTLASTPFGGPLRQTHSERAQTEEQETLNKTDSGPIKETNFVATSEIKNLSPIQEVSHELVSNSNASKSPLEPEPQETNSGGTEICQTVSERTESISALEAEAVNPCSLGVRKGLLDNVDLNSFANFSRKAGLLLEPNDDLHLDGETLYFLKKLGDQENLYLYHSNGDNVLVKVDPSSVPWEFYVTSQLKARLPSDLQHCYAQSSCYLYDNGSFTLWRIPPGQTIQLLEECVDRRDIPLLAIQLVEMVKQMHLCGLVHGALQPKTLMLCYSCEDNIMGLDFSSSLDLQLQTEVKTVQDILSAQNYIKQGLLLPSDSPYQVDLFGIAEIVHFLLFERNMTPVKEGSSWGLDADCKLNLGKPLGSLWEDFFHNLLNPTDESTQSILSNLINHLKNALNA